MKLEDIFEKREDGDLYLKTKLYVDLNANADVIIISRKQPEKEGNSKDRKLLGIFKWPKIKWR